MDELSLRKDIEGDLFLVKEGSAQRLVKRLPLGVAWHLNRYEDLQDWLDGLVQEVRKDRARKMIEIRYLPEIRALNLAELRAFLRPDQPLAAWRVALLGISLGEILAECHAARLPQMVIHPERVGLLRGKFVLLPSLAGVLPPFPLLVENGFARWLEFLAPEVLRTRAMEAERLEKGDVYSLGVLLQALTRPDWQPSSPANPLEALEEIVEGKRSVFEGTAAEEFRDIIKTAEKMSAWLPEERMSLDEALADLRGVLAKIEPHGRISSLIAQGKLGAARKALQALRESKPDEPFPFSPVKLHLLEVELALAASPPSYPEAISSLRKAQSYEPRNPQIHLRIAQVYASFKTHPQYLLFSATAYQEAASLLGWRADIVDAWAKTLGQLNDPQITLEQTKPVPWELRSPAIMQHRIYSLIELKHYDLAWVECAAYFERFNFEARVYEMAREAASQIAPLELIYWMYRHGETPGSEAALSIVWERNGNLELAGEKLAQALAASASKDRT